VQPNTNTPTMMFAKTLVALVALASSADARSLRGLSEGNACPLIQCDISFSGSDYQSAMASSITKAEEVCKASPNCVTDVKSLGASDKGCFVAFNAGVITATSGFTGELQTYKCGTDKSIVPKLIVQQGAQISSITTNGGEATTNAGSSIAKITTNGGSVKGAASGVKLLTTNGGNIAVDAGNSMVDKVSLDGGTVHLTAAEVGTLSLNGGTADLTSEKVGAVSLNGGTATVKKAKVGTVKTNGGIVNLEGGATATKYTGFGGKCNGCPKNSNKW